MVSLSQHLKIPLIFMVGFLTSCNMAKDTELQARVNAMSACEKIDGLISAYTTDFAPVKGRELSNRYMGIWSAKVKAIGESCQVWMSSETKTTYVCTENAPSKEVAMEWYRQAISTMGPCMIGWQQEEQERKDDPGFFTLWTKAGKFPSVSAHVFPVRGRQWSLYFFVGDEVDLF